jgi:hypothetical protein
MNLFRIDPTFSRQNLDHVVWIFSAPYLKLLPYSSGHILEFGSPESALLFTQISLSFILVSFRW